MTDRPAPALRLLRPPYRRLHAPEDRSRPFAGIADLRGTVLIWTLAPSLDGEVLEAVRCRPGGVPLVVVLPPAEETERPDDILRVVELCRPQSVLPHHSHPDVSDLRSVLCRPPEGLHVEVGDYLTWRGIVLDSDTRRIVRRIFELSAELRTVSALARSLYLSRRALGRRFMKRGLPVPSHWLQVARILRATIRLQGSDDNVFVVAAGIGYPDGFSLSNQMKRLVGVRPTRVRERLGWEWVFEAWLRKEAREGGFSDEWTRIVLRDAPEARGEDSSDGEGATTEEPERPERRERQRPSRRQRRTPATET